MKWEMVKLGDVAKLITGKTPPTVQTEYFDGDIIWITPSDFNSKYLAKSKRTLSFKAVSEKKCNFLPKNAVLLSCIGDIGKVGILKEAGTSNQQITGLVLNENVSPEYIYYFFINNKAYLEGMANKAVVPILNNERLKTFQIPLPPLATQKRIAAILDAADALRRKDQALLQKYDELAQAIFVDMFGDPVKNEKGWEVKSLGEIFPNFKYGTNQKSNESSEGIPVLRIPNVIGNQINLTDLKHSQLDEKEMMTTQLKKGDLLFVRTNGNPNYIGRSALFLEDGQFSYASYLIRARMAIPNIPFCNYIQYALSYKTYRPTVLKKATTTAGNYNINTDSLKSLTVPVPSQELMETFFEELRIIGNLSRLLSNTRFSETLFQSLLQKAFNAELVP